jgi:hypothetical protein
MHAVRIPIVFPLLRLSTDIALMYDTAVVHLHSFLISWVWFMAAL